MSHRPDDCCIGLDPDDMTPRQLRMALRQAASLAAMHAVRKGKKASKPDEEEDEEEEDKENDDLVELHAEHKGDSKPPPVKSSDLPKGVKIPKDESESEEEET